jgi:hypothetical protein
MSTPSALVPADTSATVRRGGWWLLASFGAFLAGFVVVMLQGILDGTIAAENEAAERLGVGVNELPPEVVAEIHGQPGRLEGLLIALPLVLAPVLFVIGVRAASAVATAAERRFAVVARVLAVACAVTWIAVQVLSYLLEVENLPVQGPVTLLVTLMTAFGGGAMAALALTLRPLGIARRTGAVVAVLGGLSVLTCFVLPPFAPFLLAVILGVALVRTRPSATM